MPTGTERTSAWLPDPTGRHQSRYYDGLRWTSHVSDDGVAGWDSVLPRGHSRQPGPASPATKPPKRQPTRAHKVLGWAVILVIVALVVGALVAHHNAGSSGANSGTSSDLALGTNKNFLTVVHAAAPSASAAYSDSDLLAAGQLICRFLEQGATGDELTAARKIGVTAEDQGVLEGAAVVNFCPNEQAQLNNTTSP